MTNTIHLNNTLHHNPKTRVFVMLGATIVGGDDTRLPVRLLSLEDLETEEGKILLLKKSNLKVSPYWQLQG